MSEKELLLQKIDTAYLRDFSVGFNNTPRYECLQKDDSELIKYFSQKFSAEQLNEILSSYLLDKPASDIANKLRERNGKEITQQFVLQLKPGEKAKKEFVADGRLCDLLLLNAAGELVAIEVKANGDKVQPAVSQCEDYKKWAEKVYLLIEERKLPELKKITLPGDVGLIIFDGTNFSAKVQARKIAQPIENFVMLMPTRTIEKLLGELRLKKSGKKPELQSRLIAYANENNVLPRIKASLFY